jgi:hypothetical protein
MFGLFQVENFFFVSLAIIFVLVILLVYLFKQRINSIETNETSMFGLLQKVVNEVKDLKRRVFCSGGKEDVEDDNDALDSNNIQQMAATEDDHIQYEIIEVDLSPTAALVKESPTLTGIDEEDDEEEDAEDIDMEEDAEDMDNELSTAEYNDIDAEDNEIDADAEDNDIDIDDEDNDADANITFMEADKPSNDDLIDVSVIGDEEEDIVLDVEDFNAASSTRGMDPIHDDPSPSSLVKETTTSSMTTLKKMHIHELRSMAIAKGCLPDVVNKMKKSEIVRLL